MNWFYTLSSTGLFFFLSIVTIVISIIAAYAVKIFVPIELRYKDNPVIGNVGALISIIYGVLVGLTALYLINTNSATSAAVQDEANAAAAIYRDSKWLKEPLRELVQTEIKNYLTQVINVEFPLMRSGKDHDKKGLYIIDKMNDGLHSYQITDNSQMVIVRDVVDRINKLYDAREERIHMSTATLNSAIWFVIIVGTILTIAINYLFAMNFYMHLIAVTAVALMASSMIYLLVSLDRPFLGEFAIEPTPLQSVLDSIKPQNLTS